MTRRETDKRAQTTQSPCPARDADRRRNRCSMECWECLAVRHDQIGVRSGLPGHAVKRKKYCEAGGKTKKATQALLDKRRRDLSDGKWTNPAKPLTFDDLIALVKADWRNTGAKSTLYLPDGKTEQSGIRKLRAAFGQWEVADIALHLENYSNKRQEEDRAAVSTVRNELNVLKNGMYLAQDKDLLTKKVPKFPELKPTNIRKGFFEREQLDSVLAELPEAVRPVALSMYWTGWRRREVLSRQWSHVDFKAGVIRLEPGETKNGKGRDFPYTIGTGTGSTHRAAAHVHRRGRKEEAGDRPVAVPPQR